jgi:hypothetical protein
MRLPREARSVAPSRSLSVPLITLAILLGIVPANAQVTANPSNLAFGDLQIGNQSTLPVVLTNNGSSVVSITTGLIHGAGFAVTGVTLPIVIGAGQNFTLNVTFAPTADGVYSGNISGSGSSGLIVNLPVTGYGTQAGYSVNLSWQPSTSPEVVGYNVYRAGQAGGPYARINPRLDPNTAYIDCTVLSGEIYYYVTRAVNSAGQESEYSNQTEVMIPEGPNSK